MQRSGFACLIATLSVGLVRNLCNQSGVLLLVLLYNYDSCAVVLSSIIFRNSDLSCLVSVVEGGTRLEANRGLFER